MPAAGRFERAIAALDAANREDPARESYGGEELPAELAYSLRMTAWLERLAPEASEPLRLAVRAQHVRRHTIPRDSYPEGRHGYLRWRRDCQQMHAREAGRLLAEAGYDEAVIERVRSLITKQRLHDDEESQALEDAACLVFLEGYLAGFSLKHDEEKLVGILAKTWKKMSPRARDLALGLDLDPGVRALVAKATGPGGGRGWSGKSNAT